jgi:8-amino-7-oxononanoate synthase
MDGDLAPLPDLYELARRFDALLLLDEAHATGLLGPNGRGACELFPPPAAFDPDSIVRVGTLSKALGAQGGFVSGSRRLIRWLVNYARPYVFSTALAPPTAAAARRAVAIVREEPWRRQHVLELAGRLGGTVPIVPVVVGSAEAAVGLSERLRRRGLFVPAIRPPSVPDGASRLRVSVTAGHTAEDVERLSAAVAEETGRAVRVPRAAR